MRVLAWVSVAVLAAGGWFVARDAWDGPEPEPDYLVRDVLAAVDPAQPRTEACARATWEQTDARPWLAKSVTAAGDISLCMVATREPNDDDPTQDYYVVTIQGPSVTETADAGWSLNSADDVAPVVVTLDAPEAIMGNSDADGWTLEPCTGGIGTFSDFGWTLDGFGLCEAGTVDIAPETDGEPLTWSLEDPLAADLVALVAFVVVPEGVEPTFTLTAAREG
ncbi:hypothetical protein [Demequina sp. NBRC 110057]|uniref:hypothetical protein n=1 Tax=Demequina sp. NBRC 110057 TaxID=1570346 RepID=UPI000A01FB3D|nr:hypothetical protein [Demequina sp. NBRC 110057]